MRSILPTPLNALRWGDEEDTEDMEFPGQSITQQLKHQAGIVSLQRAGSAT